ncbi:MAG: FkbM family methyltransferase [Flavobacterium sp.]|nr:FkbM family methyltransferase [Flavobacterium sp.]
MILKKFKKIYRILVPLNLTPNEIFENRLYQNHLIKSVKKINLVYELELLNGINVAVRDHKFSDLEVFEQIFNQEEYALILKMFLTNNFFSEDKIIIDAGANVGFTSVYFSHFLTNEKIFCVEPSPENIEMCSKNIQYLKNFKNIILYPNALSEKPDMNYEIDRNFRDKKDWSITTSYATEGSIKGISIGEIISQNSLNHISLLKIDIEGAERFIFKAENDLSFLKITEIIALEIHDEFDIRTSITNLLVEHDFLVIESGELTIGINKLKFNK